MKNKIPPYIFCVFILWLICCQPGFCQNPNLRSSTLTGVNPVEVFANKIEDLSHIIASNYTINIDGNNLNYKIFARLEGYQDVVGNSIIARVGTVEKQMRGIDIELFSNSFGGREQFVHGFVLDVGPIGWNLPANSEPYEFHLVVTLDVNGLDPVRLSSIPIRLIIAPLYQILPDFSNLTPFKFETVPQILNGIYIPNYSEFEIKANTHWELFVRPESNEEINQSLYVRTPEITDYTNFVNYSEKIVKRGFPGVSVFGVDLKVIPSFDIAPDVYSPNLEYIFRLKH